MKQKKEIHAGSSYKSYLINNLKDPEFAGLFSHERIKYEIAGLVKKTRLKAGLTQKQVSELAGLHQTAVARIESRKSRMIPSIETLRKIFVPLGYNVTFHLGKLKKAA